MIPIPRDQTTRFGFVEIFKEGTAYVPYTEIGRVSWRLTTATWTKFQWGWFLRILEELTCHLIVGSTSIWPGDHLEQSLRVTKPEEFDSLVAEINDFRTSTAIRHQSPTACPPLTIVNQSDEQFGWQIEGSDYSVTWSTAESSYRDVGSIRFDFDQPDRRLTGDVIWLVKRLPCEMLIPRQPVRRFHHSHSGRRHRH